MTRLTRRTRATLQRRARPYPSKPKALHVMIDLLTPLGATMTQTVTAIAAVAVVALAAMGIWDWFRARFIEQWDRDYR